MDVDQLVTAGLVAKSGDKIRMLSARDRRRKRALESGEIEETLFGSVTTPKKRTKKEVLKVHPNDPQFRTALDACHALALRYIEAKGEGAGIGSAKALARQQNWNKDSAAARLMQALVNAAPEAVRHEKGKKSAAALFPEFRAWHALLEPLFGMAPPDWTEKAPPQGVLALQMPAGEGSEEEETEGAEDEEETEE
jgi:putative DNA methylase